MARSDRRRVLFGVVLVSALPLVVACNDILGLTDFEKTECSGGRCGDGSFVPDVIESDVIDSGVVDAQDESTGATPAVWPRWPMPNYDGGTDFLPNQISYTSASPVTDGVTGLVWQAKPSGVVAYADAENYCAGLPGGPWRLPKRIELVSLLDFGRAASPWIDARFSVPNVKVWTSSQQKPLNATAPRYWIVDFESGLVTVSASTSNDVRAALCVKGK